MILYLILILEKFEQKSHTLVEQKKLIKQFKLTKPNLNLKKHFESVVTRKSTEPFRKKTRKLSQMANLLDIDTDENIKIMKIKINQKDVLIKNNI